MKNKTITPKQAGNELRTIIAKLKAGAEYYQCELEAKTLIDIINEHSEKLAKKFKVKYKKISFSSIVR